jgi:hypothetical protein
MATLQELEGEVREIRARNEKVERDKAWETSYARRGLLALFTYLAIGFYLEMIKVSEPWLNAIIPALAFMLSTLTLPFFKSAWLKQHYKKTKKEKG